MIFQANPSEFNIFLAVAALGFIFVIASSVAAGRGESVQPAGESGPRLLSGPVLSMFVTAFGSFGALGIHQGRGLGLSLIMALGGGLLFAGVTYLLVIFLYAQRASRRVQISDLIGKTAQVSMAIPQDGTGQVRCTLGDTVIEKIARAANNEAIPVDALVRITEIAGEMVLVERTE